MERELREKLLNLGLVVDNEYLDKYINLICLNCNTCRQKFKTQSHHIVPRYYFKDKNINLDNTKDNLVNLLFKDHLLAHYFLLKCSSTDYFKYSNILAIQYMLDKNVEITDNTLNDLQCEYEKLREYAINNNPMFNVEKKAKHDEIMASDDVRLKISNTMKEKIKNGEFFSKEHREKLSKSSKGKIYIHKGDTYTTVALEDLDSYLNTGWEKGNRPLTKEHIEALRRSHLGKKYSDELRKKLSNAHKGKPPANKGIPCSEETKEKIRQQILGRKWVNNGVIQKQVNKNDLQYYLDNGFILGCLKKGGR